ncbi:MAG: outer membrane lipid asymmetry maintenance protein MlaD [Desulfococcaceae bacterium]|jgi:phospholipid/cholesterol/gamma-HCH transport system substrate-binding protein|nr:outer membrane lipid asymmetry maintenance protein MlaD [Desulfococcaceae bacterium]
MKKASVETAVGVFVLIGLICIAYLTVKLGKAEVLGDNYYSVSAKFQSVSGLKTGAVVELAGVQVGKVEGISLDQERMVAVVKMKIRNELKLSEDSIASVKTSGLIGDKYIKISPGGLEEMLKSGDVITETESAIDLEDMISKYVFGGM